jgi:aerobic carbon-monoxide dehydrogenase medium subunit
MIPAQFEYAAPRSIEEAVGLLTRTDGAQVLAGGHTLMPLLKLRRSTPALLVDLRRIAELRGIRHRDGKGGYHLGAMTTFAEVAANRDIAGHYHALLDAVRLIGDPQVRNRGTIGGNLASGDPGADLPAVALALEMIVNIAGANGTRAIPASEYLSQAPAARSGEILTGLDLPAVTGATGSAYEKLKQSSNYAAISGVAVRVVRSMEGTISQCRVAVTGATDTPTRLSGVEQALEGRRPTADHIAEAIREAGGSAQYRTDRTASAEYRAHLTGVLAERAIQRAVERAGFQH